MPPSLAADPLTQHLLRASLPSLAKMVSVQPSQVSTSLVDVVITFRHDAAPIYVAADVTGWEPQLMSANGEAYEHVLTVPRTTRSLLYKFRIGEDWWVHDEGFAAEPDNRGGWNNRFEIPELPFPAVTAGTPSESDVVELESVAGLESIADTVSDAAELESHGYYSEAEYVDVDDVLSESDYPVSSSAAAESQPQSSWPQILGFGVRSRY